MLSGAQKFEDRLKNFRENNPGQPPTKKRDHDREAILKEIKISQAKKQTIKIDKLLNPDQAYVELEQLKNVTWNGIPENLPSQRCESWKLLLDYMPIDKEFREEVLKNKR